MKAKMSFLNGASIYKGLWWKMRVCNILYISDIILTWSPGKFSCCVDEHLSIVASADRSRSMITRVTVPVDSGRLCGFKF